MRIVNNQLAYKLVRVTRYKSSKYFYKIQIPAEIGDLVPNSTAFIPEVIEEGILLRRVDVEAPKRIASWLKQPTPIEYKEKQLENLPEEIQLLLEEQKKDDTKFGSKPWEISLNKKLFDSDTELIDLIEDPSIKVFADD